MLIAFHLQATASAAEHTTITRCRLHNARSDCIIHYIYIICIYCRLQFGSRMPGIRQDKMRAMLPPSFLKGSPLQNNDFDYVDENNFRVQRVVFLRKPYTKCKKRGGRAPGLYGQRHRRVMLPLSFLKGSPLQNHDFDYVDEDEF